MEQEAPVPVREMEIQGLSRISRGKVRDIFEIGGRLLIVTTDRISAYDCVLPNAIPFKGIVLNQISLFWFQRFQDLVAGHVITGRVEEMPDVIQSAAEILRGRSMLVQKARVLPVECIVRGHLSGSGWKEYQRYGTVCKIPLPAGLGESARLPEPLFTPSTKAETGHDENIPFSEMERLVGAGLAARVRDVSLRLYTEAARYALERGLIIADTKFEFGLTGEVLTLVDEVLTPDSSRFWPAAAYREGGPQPSFDKQYVRDYLSSLDWDRNPPAPGLPPEVVAKTSEKYLEAYRLLTGTDVRLTLRP